MKLTDEEFNEILAALALKDIKDIPADPVEARAAIEQFVDLVEFVMRPLPLPPEGGSSFKPLP